MNEQFVSRKERRERERLENKNKSNGNGTVSRRIFLWVAVVAVIALAVGGLIWLAAKTPSGSSGRAPRPIANNDWIKGGADAKVTLIEYSDFQCPACGRQYPIVKKLTDEFGDKIRFVYRHFPLIEIHQNAEMAAYAAQSAGRQGKFWEMHDLLFENQKDWSDGNDVKKIFIQYAGQLGLDQAKFKSDLDSKEVKRAVEDDRVDGLKIGVDGTPTFFLNNEKIETPSSYDEFKSLVDQRLKTQ